MNILLSVTAYPPSIGGAQLLMHQLARQLNLRHRVQVVTQWDMQRTDWLLGTTLRAPRQAYAYQIDGVSVQRITLSSEVRRRLIPWVLAYYVVQGLALGRTAEALMIEIAPLAAQSDLIHNCRIGREGLSYASYKTARERDVPFVLTPVHHPRWGGWLHRHYHRLYRQADAVIALTEAERQMLVELGVDQRRVCVTGMGPVLAEACDGARFRAHYSLSDDPLVLFLAQKYPYKGLAALLEATQLVWQRLPEVRFAFVGPRTAYSCHLFAGGCEARILELDTVSLQEKTDALAACEVLCVPSSQESFGAVYLEAWVLGKPVVGGDAPAVAEVITDGVDGFRVSPQPAEIADRIITLLTNPGLREQMGRAGWAKAQRFTWPALAARTEAVYQALLEGRWPADV